jgi:hypothetical protein
VGRSEITFDESIAWKIGASPLDLSEHSAFIEGRLNESM